jgi:hypothetical protein
MTKHIRFNEKPKLEDLTNLTLSIDNEGFRVDEGLINHPNGIVLPIVNSFRFTAYLEVVKTTKDKWFLVLTELLTNHIKYRGMEDAFDRMGFRTPEIEKQMRSLIDQLIESDLAQWVDADI